MLLRAPLQDDADKKSLRLGELFLSTIPFFSGVPEREKRGEDRKVFVMKS